MKTKMKMKMKQQIQVWLDAHVPLGLNGTAHAGWISGGIIGAALFHFIRFAAHYDYCVSTLYRDDKRTILIDPSGEDQWVYMPSFGEMMENSYYLFILIALLMVALSIYNYKYHFQGSKSIYLMNRLPDDKDLMRRCLTLPTLGILACIILAALVTGLCYLVYMTNTPDVYLT